MLRQPLVVCACLKWHCDTSQSVAVFVVLRGLFFVFRLERHKKKLLCFSHLVPLFFLFSWKRGRSHMCGGLKNNINVWRSNNDTLRVTQKHHPCSSNSTHFFYIFLHHRHYNMSRAVRAPTCLPHHVLNFQQVCHHRMQLPSERASVARHGLFRDIVMDWTLFPTVAPGSTFSMPWRDLGVKRNYAELAATRKRIEFTPLSVS